MVAVPGFFRVFVERLLVSCEKRREGKERKEREKREKRGEKRKEREKGGSLSVQCTFRSTVSL